MIPRGGDDAVAGNSLLTVRFSLTPRRPYSLALTAERYTRFPEVVDRFAGGVYRRLLPVGRGVLLSVEQAGPPSAASLEIRLDGRLADSDAARTAARRVAEVTLGAASDVASFYRAHRGDPVLGPADPGVPGSAGRRRAVAVGSPRHGGPRAAGQPDVRLRHPPGARPALRAAGALLRRDLRGLPADRAARGRNPAPAAALPALTLEGPRDPRPRARVRGGEPLRGRALPR